MKSWRLLRRSWNSFRRTDWITWVIQSASEVGDAKRCNSCSQCRERYFEKELSQSKRLILYNDHDPIISINTPFVMNHCWYSMEVSNFSICTNRCTFSAAWETSASNFRSLARKGKILSETAIKNERMITMKDWSFPRNLLYSCSKISFVFAGFQLSLYFVLFFNSARPISRSFSISFLTLNHSSRYGNLIRGACHLAPTRMGPLEEGLPDY